ncbi:MAG: GPW/gp25 family protein [Gammaproteobacteria bacterium]|nr:GPW/gp25 family protein [Gammaproteobacteria bacterium]
MNRTTGKHISGMDEINQSVNDIIMTPIGSRVMNRDYGSYVFEFIDHPAHGANLMKIYASIVDALIRWEPRVFLLQIQLASERPESGVFDIHMEAITTEQVGDVPVDSPVGLTATIGGQG